MATHKEGRREGDVCSLHSGFEADIKNIITNQNRMEANMNNWHEHINCELSEMRKSLERVPVLWEVHSTTRTMVYGAYACIAGLAAWIYYLLGGSK